jgi:hypothetical protein
LTGQEIGDRRQETGDRRQEKGGRRQETGGRRQETGEEEIMTYDFVFFINEKNKCAFAKLF